MMVRHGPAAGTAGHRVVHATLADIEALSQVIAGAFHDLGCPGG